jgi:hypothetical protein
MSAADLIKSPELVHDVPAYDLELTTREVVEALAEKSRSKNQSGKRGKGTAEKVMRFVGEVYKRNPELCTGLICAYGQLGGDIETLVRAATKLKNDPEVGPFLSYLRTALIPTKNRERFVEGRKLIRRAEERACMWSGKNAAETRARIGHYGLDRKW